MDPIERTIHIYRLGERGHHGKPEVMEMNGETPVGVLPGVVIRWDALLERLPPSQD